MMLKNIILCLILFGSAGISNVRAFGRVIIRGEFESKPDSIRLIYQVWSTSGRSISVIDTYDAVKVTGNKFKISVPVSYDFIYFTMFDEISGKKFVGKQYLKAGDSINIFIKNEGNSYGLEYTGKSSESVKVFNVLDSMNFILRENGSDKRRIVKTIDSIRNVKIKILNDHKNIVRKDIYPIVVADIYGDARFKVIQYCFPSYLNLYLNHQTDGLDADSSIFDSLKYESSPLSDIVLAASDSYLSFLSTYVVAKIYRETKGKPLSFEENLSYILNNFHYPIRDHLIGRLFGRTSLYSFYSSGINPLAFKNGLIASLQVCKDKSIVGYISTLRLNNTMGVDAYNFDLPLDSSRHRLKLEEYKNKVVLLDMWGYMCTGCYMFSKIFHNEIYPEFKSDTNFVVVSMMLESSMASAGMPEYMYRLRGLGSNKYTYPEYVNLYAASGETEADSISTHYSINTAPFVILMKNGKIFSSTPPLFTTNSSPNVSNLRNLIRMLLSDSD